MKSLSETMLDAEEAVCVNLILEDCLAKFREVGKEIPIPTRAQRPLGPVGEMHEGDLWHEVLPTKLNNPITVASEWNELQWIQTLRDDMEDLIIELLEEFHKTQTFSSLSTNLEKRRLKVLEELQIFIKEDVTADKLHNLQSQILPKTLTASENSGKEDRILYLKDRLRQEKTLLLSQVKYTKKREDAYLNQVKKKGELEEQRIRNDLKSLMNNVDAEDRTHEALMKSLEKSIQKLEAAAEYWEKKFEEETSIKDEEIQDLKCLKERDRKYYEDTVKMIEEQTQVIQEDRAKKAEIKRLEEEERKELESATQIQSWWRGMMVRKCLGPFRKYKHIIKAAKKKSKKAAKSKEATSGEDSDAQKATGKEKKTKGKKKTKSKPKPKEDKKPKKKEKKKPKKKTSKK